MAPFSQASEYASGCVREIVMSLYEFDWPPGENTLCKNLIRTLLGANLFRGGVP